MVLKKKLNLSMEISSRGRGCYACKFPIKKGEEFVQILGMGYHTDCFIKFIYDHFPEIINREKAEQYIGTRIVSRWV